MAFPVTQPDGNSRTDSTDPHADSGIDVVRGPSSAMYGNYATGGAINFMTRPGHDIQGVEFGTALTKSRRADSGIRFWEVRPAKLRSPIHPSRLRARGRAGCTRGSPTQLTPVASDTMAANDFSVLFAARLGVHG
jgi:outer membrane receptor protein involved in Fe transport